MQVMVQRATDSGPPQGLRQKGRQKPRGAKAEVTKRRVSSDSREWSLNTIWLWTALHRIQCRVLQKRRSSIRPLLCCGIGWRGAHGLDLLASLISRLIAQVGAATSGTAWTEEPKARVLPGEPLGLRPGKAAG
jgi:hypothetical protein